MKISKESKMKHLEADSIIGGNIESGGDAADESSNSDKTERGVGGQSGGGDNGEDSALKAGGSKKKRKICISSVKKVVSSREGDRIGEPSEEVTPRGTCRKRVQFAEQVEVLGQDEGEDKMVYGKRFSVEEDNLIREAISNYIQAHGLGDEGLNMILHSKRYRHQVRGCWKEIRAALPWRPLVSVYSRAHVLFERGESRAWTPEEYEFVHKFHRRHGPDWKTMGEALGRHRLHVKEAWRRTKYSTMKKGHLSQDEYQALFDLVNLDMRRKALDFKVKKRKRGMLRDDISWSAISDRMRTRSDAVCCEQWYRRLASTMVLQGQWMDVDDYHLLIELYLLDASCIEDVDWDILLEHRTGYVCRKRWKQMVKHLGDGRAKTFADQVEILMNRYCPDVLEARELYESSTVRPSSSSAAE